jgi:hypothetical protein
VSILLLVLVISLANLALGFGLAVQLGYGPDLGSLPLFSRREAPATKDEHS